MWQPLCHPAALLMNSSSQVLSAVSQAHLNQEIHCYDSDALEWFHCRLFSSNVHHSGNLLNVVQQEAAVRIIRFVFSRSLSHTHTQKNNTLSVKYYVCRYRQKKIGWWRANKTSNTTCYPQNIFSFSIIAVVKWQIVCVTKDQRLINTCCLTLLLYLKNAALYPQTIITLIIIKIIKIVPLWQTPDQRFENITSKQEQFSCQQRHLPVRVWMHFT